MAGEDLGMSSRRLLCLVFACLVFAAIASACHHDEIGVEYTNLTSQHVTVYKENVSGSRSFGLAPNESQRSSMFRKNWRPYVKVVTDDGRVLLEANITIDELKAMKYRIVITDPDPP